MPRQNFLSKESFLDSSEKQARDSVMSIPAFASNIRFVSENRMIESLRFSYEVPVKNIQFYIDVTIQPLNNKFTRVSLHGTHVSGMSLANRTADMAIALHDFESAVMAALKSDVSLYQPYQPKVSSSKKIRDYAGSFAALLGMVMLKKKLS